ncbi:disease resistance protein RGA2-like [Rhodamnia argentea]|uniref:Disease resistance protein RGA2-like n=1 Tax=Rhodamnia argentea TaxID=178133 RepID=A0ABM3H465_9MYRT|nr:disease resistance protein RGA2-like [Rhodamnia argentea]
MAESLVFSIAQGVLGKIASSAFQEAVAIYSVKDEIHELEDTMAAITAVLLDAEEQQAKNHGLQLWLRRLRDVLYDAEDVLDELECEALRKQVINRYGGIKEKVRRFFSLSNTLILRAKISHKSKEIRETLSKIFIEKNQFDLNVRSVDNGVAHLRSREMTYSFVSKLDVVGRESDKEKIIEILMQPDQKTLSVIPIVGIGGMGKTALAKLVYNDDNVKKQFESRLWVCVPEDFDLKKTIEAIIKDATGQSLSNLDIQQLQTSLRDIIKDKKFLLVLDDVWSDDRSRWEELKALLTEGASGSKIIVTTRSSKVAFIMGTHPVHNLKGLSHEDSMALFQKWAFDQKEKHPRPDFLEMGNDIVKKCQGVPLLVKTLGSLLYTKEEVRYWAHIRDSEVWKLVEERKDLLPVLKLSYDHLPSHLKRCFATFALFPRGFELDSNRLDDLWMASGLMSSTAEKEDSSVEYVKELWKRSLIQDVEESESILTFKVHDLVHSLATIVARNDCSIVSLDTEEISEGARYISFSSDSLEGISNFDGVPPFLRKPTSKRLRVIKFQFDCQDGVITREFARTCISKCNHLRYLNLMGGTFEELPSSICNFKQLRTLLLSGNKRLKKLPDTICELQSLLHLYLNRCSELGELPKNMKRLVSLRKLYVTTKQKSLQESGIQYLKSLQFLGLKGCQNLQVLFEGTCQLTCLRRLEILNCRGPISIPFAELIALQIFVIDDSNLMLTEENKPIFPSNLHTLAISKSEQVMELLQCLDQSACELEAFSVYDCPSFTAVPEWLPNHTHLRLIRLIRCPKLPYMPQGIQSITALKELRVESCGELSERCRPTMGVDWPKIAHIPRICLDLIWVQWMED